MIYLDYNATTPVLCEVRETIALSLAEDWGNPSSLYRLASRSQRTLEDARSRVSALVKARSDQIVFTSGATEANNAAIQSAIVSKGVRRLVTVATEHSSVLEPCRVLADRFNRELCYLEIDREGLINLEHLQKLVSGNESFVSIMWANNETGVIQPINQIAETCSRNGALFHCDAVQALGKVDIDVSSCPFDFLSISGHKFGAPKGVGALYVKQPDRFAAFLLGGKQESGKRGGTENVPYIVGLGVAAEIAQRHLGEGWPRVGQLRDYLETILLSSVPGAQVNGRTLRLPNTSNIYFPDLDADAMVTFLDSRDICVSSGSACMESALAPSHVILAMTDSHQRASESVRFSLGLDTTKAEMDQVIQAVTEFQSMMV